MRCGAICASVLVKPEQSDDPELTWAVQMYWCIGKTVRDLIRCWIHSLITNEHIRCGARIRSDKIFAIARLTMRNLGDGRAEMITDVGMSNLARDWDRIVDSKKQRVVVTSVTVRPLRPFATSNCNANVCACSVSRHAS